MAWSRTRSQERIDRFLQTVPQRVVTVRRLDETFVQERRAQLLVRSLEGQPQGQLVADIGRNTAVIVDGVHVYIQLLDFSDALMDQQRETEASHERVLGMLHLHYAACDCIARDFEAQRVDFHGSRMHAVIATPTGTSNVFARAQRALEFADAVKRSIELAGDRVANGRFRSRVRIGLDSGTAVAINNGRSDEREPLFLGNPANYAAKLSEGATDGIYPSNRVRREAEIATVGSGSREILVEAAVRIDIDAYPTGMAGHFTLTGRASQAVVERAADTAVASLASHAGDATNFTFRRMEPPLKSIVFGELSPSRSIRMELVSVFADIDGFTAYVERCIEHGRVAEMVTNLHVMRGELAATLKHDFGGRKVRFIGDCVHGLVAEGTRMETDEPGSVRKAVEAVAGMRSSFELCKENLENVRGLGIAIGLELGTTPITRIGIRGDKGVRTSVSKAVSGSEALQRQCDGQQTAIGPRASRAAPASVRALFDERGFRSGLDTDSLLLATSTPLQAPSVLGGLFQPLKNEERAAVRKEGGGTYG